MKKLITAIIGVALSLAAYQQNRRQTEYISTQQASMAATTTYATPVSSLPKIKPIFALRFSRP